MPERAKIRRFLGVGPLTTAAAANFLDEIGWLFRPLDENIDVAHLIADTHDLVPYTKLGLAVLVKY